MNANTLKITLSAAVLSVAVATTASAAELYYDGFSGYSTGSINGQAAQGADKTGNWSNEATGLSADVNFNVVSTGLTYTQGLNTLTTSSGALNAFRSAGVSSRKSVQAGPSSFDTSLPSSLWMSALVDYDGTAETGNALLGFSIADGNALDDAETRSFGIGLSGANVGAYQGSTQFMPDFGLLAVDTGVALTTGVNLVVARLDDAGDVMTVWLNPTFGTTPTGGTTVALAPLSGGLVGGNASWGINSVFASHDFADGSATVLDELRVGNTFADVTPFATIPEPSSFALLAGSLALCGILLRRRHA